MRKEPEERALGALEARMEEVRRECNPQEVANTLWAYATMGKTPGERALGALGALEARVEEVRRECNPQEVLTLCGRMRRWGRRRKSGRWGP